ncbi:hypothetical protein FOZ61_008897 [Perkinsus olseni]|uniref:SURP motif domain-containing protein n=1 Tax=Perkinsus olseni TaxID=32597 RepID=A0A7J6M699_PEROL|nr:hypothetical protein FOZ61_008897 [Perkinsus olseni]
MASKESAGPYLPVFIEPPSPEGTIASEAPRPKGITVRELLVIHHTARFMRIHGDQTEIACRLNPAMEAYVPFLSPEHPYYAYYSYVKRYNLTLSKALDATPAYECLLPPGWKERDAQLSEQSPSEPGSVSMSLTSRSAGDTTRLQLPHDSSLAVAFSSQDSDDEGKMSNGGMVS